MGRWRGVGLAGKLTAAFGLMLVVVALGVSLLFITVSRRNMLGSLESRARTLVQPLALALGEPLITNHGRLQQLVEEARRVDGDVVYAVVVDNNGNVVGSTDAAQIGTPLLRDDFDRSALAVADLTKRPVPGRRGVFEIVAPITYTALGKMGVVRVGFSSAGVDAAVRKAAVLAAAVALGVLAAGVLGSFYVTRRLLWPVVDAADRLQQLASGDADLTRRLHAATGDEVGMLARSFNTFVENLGGIIASVRLTAASVTDASRRLSGTTGNLAAGTQQQAASLEETAASLEQITATVKQNADNARQASELARGSREAAERGGGVVASAVSSMEEITRASKRIADIIGVIDEIAFQTNLLALNAAVEAARAGEQGRGFAVVAAEVRNLAQRSAGAAREIKALIQDSVAKVEEGAQHVNRSGRTLDEIVQSAKRVADIVSDIAAACQEQSSGIDQVNRAVAQMDRVTQENASQTEEISATSRALAEQAHRLLDLVGRFLLPEERGESAAAAAPGEAPASGRSERRRRRGIVGHDGASIPADSLVTEEWRDLNR